jgi:hypothetical protein
MKEIVYTSEQMKGFRDAMLPNVVRAATGGPLVASEAACRFCKAAAVCPELKKETLVLAQREFASIVTMSGDELSDVLNKGDMIENFMKSARAHAIKLLEIDPTSVPGWKRVQGEKKRRVEGAKKWLWRSFKKSLKLDVVAPRKLVSPASDREGARGGARRGRASARRCAGSRRSARRRRKRSWRSTRRSRKGMPTLVRAGDAREALGPVFTEADIAALGPREPDEVID